MKIIKSAGAKRDELSLTVGLLFIAILIAYAFYTIRLNSENNQWVRHTNEVLRESDALLSAMKDAETGQRGFILTGEKVYLEPFNSASQSTKEIHSRLKLLTSDNPAQQERLEKMEDIIEQKFKELEETIQLRQEAGMEAALEVVKTNKGKQLMGDFRELISLFQLEENTLLQKRTEEANTSTSYMLFAQSIGGALVIIFLLMAIINVRNQKKDRKKLFIELDSKSREYLLNDGKALEEEKEVISSLVTNLQSAQEFIRKIGKKDFDARIPGLTDEQIHLNKANMAGALIEVRDLLNEKEKEEGRRKWTNEGIARFSELIRKHNQSLERLSDEVLQQLVKYVKANQGALYIVNSEETGEEMMEMAACYAWNKKKYISTKIGKGEGLAGQAWQECDTLYLTDVPNDYIKITSGLGGANPCCILIVPLKVNEKVLGVLEIASFQQLEKFEIEFIEKIAETVASALSTVKVNEQTKALLEMSQQQTEEMRAQEEEMRQNMEELEATQEEMRRQEVEMRGQLTAANNTLATIEFDLQGKILNANQNFLSAMGYSLEEIRGRHHRIFCETAYANSDEYKSLWETLNNGISTGGEFKRLTKSGKEVWLRASYTPVTDHFGRAVKVIKYALEITNEKLESLALHGQVEAINRSNAVIEFSKEGKILKANELFLNTMNYEEKEIIGKHHSIFVPKEIRETQEYKDLWQKLQAGEYLEGEFERIEKGGRTIWIKGTYNPVFDLDGKVVRVIKIAQDITEKKILEEDMRQHMEEMQATQEELGPKLNENERIKRNLDAVLTPFQ